MIKPDTQMKVLLNLIAVPSHAVLTNECYYQLYMSAVHAGECRRALSHLPHDVALNAMQKCRC